MLHVRAAIDGVEGLAGASVVEEVGAGKSSTAMLLIVL